MTNSADTEMPAVGRLDSVQTLELLEFPRLRRTLAGFASCERAKRKANALVPQEDLVQVRQRLEGLHEAKRLVERIGEWPAPPSEDIAPLVERAVAGRRLGGDEVAVIGRLLDAVDRSLGYWKNATEETPVLASLAERLSRLPEVSEGIANAVEEDGSVRDSASPELRRLRRRIRDRRTELRERLEKLVRRGGAWAEAADEGLLTVRDERYLVAVRADRFDRKRGVIHDVSGSGATLFVEPFEALPLNNQLREWLSAEADEVDRILSALTALVALHSGELEHAQETLADLDELAARVRLSLALDATTPRFDEDGGRLVLRGSRHPLLWLQAGGASEREKAAKSVVPFDLEMHSPVRVLLVSGPNMGGKTVLLKAVGLALVMGLAGLDVCAAEGAILPWLDRLFVDIGDAQSLEENLSTFAARLRRMDAMARGADANTFCLLDELGGGTDPGEGAALGRSLLEHLAGRRSWVVATTHLGALKVLAAERSEVENASMAIDLERLRPLYRLQIGVPGGSHGLATARRLGVTEEVLERAERSVSEDALALEGLIAELGEELRVSRERRAELDRRLEEARAQSKRLEDQEEEAREERRSKERRRLDELRALEGRARELLRRLRREANRAPAEREPDLLRRLGEEVRGLEQTGDRWRAAEATPPATDRPAEIRPGVEVKHAVLGVVFRVLEGPREDGTVLLGKGAWKTTARIPDLQAAETGGAPGGRTPAAPGGSGGHLEPGVDEDHPWEVDLRGCFVEDALAELDRALDRAILSGFRQFRIIHGVGRGVLQRAVAEHLRGHEQVRRYRLGVHGEGGRGVTVVELV